MRKYLFFDNASTTRCCEEAAALVHRFTSNEYGNPSSSHVLGQQAAKAIRDSRLYFAKTFNTHPDQIIFTGSGSEADNLAIYGVALEALSQHLKKGESSRPPRVLASSIEHPAVRNTVRSLTSLGIDAQLVPVDAQGQIDETKFLELLTPETVLVSIQQVNNIMGSILPVERLASLAKEKVPGLIFHADAVQSFGKVQVPTAPSPIDLVSLSAHKIAGPKGVGALVVLNRQLLKSGLRPLIWGGEQEGGFRSGTQNAGLIAGFREAAEQALDKREHFISHTRMLRDRFRKGLISKGLLHTDGSKAPVRWNSPEGSVPHIISLSVPGSPSGPLAKLLEERGCLVSTGSACSSQKAEPDPVLASMGLESLVCSSAIRVSFSSENLPEDVDTLVDALHESIALMQQLLGGNRPR